MILPTKHIPEEEALLGVGATLLACLDTPATVSGFWERARCQKNVGNFERFVLASNLLFILGAIDICDGLISKVPQ